MNQKITITPMQPRKRTNKPRPCGISGCGSPADKTVFVEGREMFSLCKPHVAEYKKKMEVL